MRTEKEQIVKNAQEIQTLRVSLKTIAKQVKLLQKEIKALEKVALSKITSILK